MELGGSERGFGCVSEKGRVGTDGAGGGGIA